MYKLYYPILLIGNLNAKVCEDVRMFVTLSTHTYSTIYRTTITDINGNGAADKSYILIFE